MLDETLTFMDKGVGISFENDFNFALAALLFKGNWTTTYHAHTHPVFLFSFSQDFHILSQTSEPRPNSYYQHCSILTVPVEG